MNCFKKKGEVKKDGSPVKGGKRSIPICFGVRGSDFALSGVSIYNSPADAPAQSRTPKVFNILVFNTFL